MAFEAQGLPQSVLSNAYIEQEEKFLESFERIHVCKIPRDVNVIDCPALYKIKVLENGALCCKARIATHGTQDREEDNLDTDYEMCPQIGVRMLLSTCALMQWHLTKLYIKGAFLQSGEASRDVYVILPKEFAAKSFYWLLLVAAYELFNAIFKWQLHSDSTLFSLRLTQFLGISQRFYLKPDDALVMVMGKIVDDILIGKRLNEQTWFLQKLQHVYKIGTLSHSPGSFLYFGLKIVQCEEFYITLHLKTI